MTINNIVSRMVEQHRELGKIAENAMALKTIDDIPAIKKELDSFVSVFVKHLEMENEDFYIDLLKQMQLKGHDVKKTQQFIDEMEAIEKVVVIFLDKYKTIENIEKNFEEFKQELVDMVNMLMLRMESEETGVYGYWELF